MATFYGSDTTCTTALPLIDTQVTDPKVLIAQRITRMLQTPTGAMAAIGDDPLWGYDVRLLVNRKLAPGDLAREQMKIQAAILRDEQVQSATVTVSASLSTGNLTISIAIISAAGPFDLTLNVSALTVDLIFGSAA